MSEPRTRRQLREALNTAQRENIALEHHVSSHEIRVQSQREHIEQLDRDVTLAIKALRKAGFVESPGPAVVGQYGNLKSTHWRQPDSIVQQPIADAVNGARRGVLTSVLAALDIKGYERHGYPSINPATFGIEENIVGQDVDRFWADLQTALEVREEKRVADERKRTEEKVAGLASPTRRILGFDPAGGAAVIASYLNGGVIHVDDLTDVVKAATPEPKKSAKKKSEGKK